MNNHCCHSVPTDARADESRTSSGCGTAAKGVSYFRPDVDVLETPQGFVVRADIPGAVGDSIAIEYEQGALTVSARVEPREADGRNVLLREYGVGDYRRVFRLGESIDTSAINAAYRNGVLEITLPKVQPAQPRTVRVNVA